MRASRPVDPYDGVGRRVGDPDVARDGDPRRTVTDRYPLDDAVRTGSMRATSPAPAVVTQTEPSPTATPLGPTPTPAISCVSPVAGSICVTDPDPLFATHTDPIPTATATGTSPTEIWRMVWVARSMRDTRFASGWTVQIADPSFTLGPGAKGSRTVARGAPDAGSSRTSEFSAHCGRFAGGSPARNARTIAAAAARIATVTTASVVLGRPANRRGSHLDPPPGPFGA